MIALSEKSLAASDIQNKEDLINEARDSYNGVISHLMSAQQRAIRLREILHEIWKRKLWKDYNMTVEQFCTDKLGIPYQTAFRIQDTQEKFVLLRHVIENLPTQLPQQTIQAMSETNPKNISYIFDSARAESNGEIPTLSQITGNWFCDYDILTRLVREGHVSIKHANKADRFLSSIRKKEKREFILYHIQDGVTLDNDLSVLNYLAYIFDNPPTYRDGELIAGYTAANFQKDDAGNWLINGVPVKDATAKDVADAKNEAYKERESDRQERDRQSAIAQGRQYEIPKILTLYRYGKPERNAKTIIRELGDEDARKLAEIILQNLE